MKELIGHLIYKIVGTIEFIRRIEWRTMLKWLDPKEGERILEVACGGGVEPKDRRKRMRSSWN